MNADYYTSIVVEIRSWQSMDRAAREDCRSREPAPSLPFLHRTGLPGTKPRSRSSETTRSVQSANLLSSLDCCQYSSGGCAWDLCNRMDRRGTPKPGRMGRAGQSGQRWRTFSDGSLWKASQDLSSAVLPELPLRGLFFDSSIYAFSSHSSSLANGDRIGRGIHPSLFRLMYCVLLACARDRPFGRTPR